MNFPLFVTSLVFVSASVWLSLTVAENLGWKKVGEAWLAALLCTAVVLLFRFLVMTFL